MSKNQYRTFLLSYTILIHVCEILGRGWGNNFLSVKGIAAITKSLSIVRRHHIITSLPPEEQRGVEEAGGLERGGVVRQLLGRVGRAQGELAGGHLRPRRCHVPPEVAHRVRVVERGHEAGAVVEADLDGGRGSVRRYL